MPEFREASRSLTSVLCSLEKRTLLWLAARLPRRVSSDHLTVLALVAMLMAGLSYWLATRHRGRPAAGGRLPGVQLVRRQPRRHAGARAPAPAARYGFYGRSRRSTPPAPCFCSEASGCRAT